MQCWFYTVRTFIKITVGCLIFAVSFNLFLLPHDLTIGGLSGLSMMLVSLLDSGTIGLFTVMMNLPLFTIAGLKIGKKFFWLSLTGALISSAMIDLMSFLPAMHVEPVIAALYGGVLCGLGIGIVFSTGGSTGGSDIIIRLMKRRWKSIPIGVLTITFDILLALLIGIILDDISRTLYSIIAIFLSGQVVDAVIYRFDYSKVVWIICKDHDTMAALIARELGRGSTFFDGEGSFRHQPLKIVMTAVKRQQLPKLKELVSRQESEAFIVVQQAHQVLGDGFLRYSGELL